MSEPCVHERSDAIASFVSVVRANVVLRRDLDAATARLTAVRGLCAAATASGRDSVPTTALQAATDRARHQGAHQ